VSYQVLARKWRPQSFHDVIGQPHVLTALENGLTQDRVHHAYLFSGTRGVGKTTIARILAKSLNCEKGVTATPCGVCANCQDIDQGRFVDLLEIDAASRTKVDDTRELLDNVQYKPAQGRYKVYLIDEVHMLSKHSFNALLKTLEEPPEYVKFLLATTDPQKLPITVLSRCLQFHLKAILPEQIEQQLSTILTHEQATFEQPALRVIAKAADGSMRDALSLTDQALAFGAGDIKYDAVLKMLGTIDQSHLHYLLHFIASGNSQKVFEKIQEFVHLGADFAALHQELASLCHQIALMQLQLNANVSKKTAIQLLAERLTPEEVQLFYQIAVQGYKDYSYAPNGKIALEMTVMRLLAFKPANYVDVDEAMLTQTDLVEVIESNSATEKPVSEVVATVINDKTLPTTTSTVDVLEAESSAVELSTEHASIATDSQTKVEQPTLVTHQPASTNDSMQQAEPIQQQAEQIFESAMQGSSSEPVNESAVMPEQNPAPFTNQPVTNNPDDLTQESFNLAGHTNSRNMLRSHRLKREELKKTKAATGESVDNTQVSKQPVALETIQPITNEPVIRQAETNLSQAADVKPTTIETVVDKQERSVIEVNSTTNEQDLPPLSSYQEQNEQADYQSNPQPDNDYYAEHYVDSKVIDNTVIDDSQQVEPISTAPQTSLNNAIETVEITKEVLPQAKIKTNNDISELALTEASNTEVSLIIDQQFPSPEIDIAAYVENKMTDPWFLDIQAMKLSGFEKLLAKSCVKQQKDQQIDLFLNESQAHLLNNQSLCEGLQNLLRNYYGNQFTVVIKVGVIAGQHTPLELEQIVYQQYLDDAKNAIKNDTIVKIFVRDYAAKVYENSIVPL